MNSGEGFSGRLRFIFDQHASGPALRHLQAKGLDVVHVHDVGLSEADDPAIFVWAMKQDRIIVTRNYRDFEPLVRKAASDGLIFPGVLFFSNSIRQNDVGHHVRAVTDWLDRVDQARRNLVHCSLGWLI